MRFTGRERHTVDAKGRLTMPLRFRETILESARAKDANQLVMVPWFDECVRVFPLQSWSEHIVRMEQQLEGVDSFGYSEEESDLRRLVFGLATTVPMDGHGRFVLPADLRDLSEIERDVLWMGIGSCLELWNPHRLATQLGGERARTLRALLADVGRQARRAPIASETSDRASLEDSPAR